ncbi:hypothetical protein, partial [Thermogutta sp.]|uniref:hypothetical protein n=1 Tax=Thermogutta sp. TaxID=1962930 RepID=UPI00321F93D3
IPMPTVPPAQGVLASLPPVEAGKLIQPPAVEGYRLLYISYEMSERGGSNYHILDPQTGERIDLETFPPDQYSASLEYTMRASPAGDRILYSVFFDFSAFDFNPAVKEIGSVWTMNPDGSDKRRLVGSDDLYFPANAIWSPDGKEIAFLRLPDPRAVEDGKLKAEQTELWLMNANGSEQRKVADLPYEIGWIFGANPSMKWLLDDHIYIVTGITVDGDWLRISPRTGEIIPLVKGVQPWDVEISPDTRWIVAMGRMTDARITALGRQPLSLPFSFFGGWDSTGTHIAFMNLPYPYGDASLEPGIWVRDLQEGKQHRLTSLDVTVTPCNQLSLSPDGKILACNSDEGLYVIWVEHDRSQMVVRNPYAKERYGILKFIGWVPGLTSQRSP